ncbi:hypothetical protein GGX14DRAFT_407474 [Mycena pura]|uniref:Uncharacterized protein n=1 Tax=Mycena pura TaxID=153505 RepID=A0AAD6UN73_9AGAR|nr:hypothetical protein GGX14DRAFT_407474 [Mycena pura]
MSGNGSGCPKYTWSSYDTRPSRPVSSASASLPRYICSLMGMPNPELMMQKERSSESLVTSFLAEKGHSITARENWDKEMAKSVFPLGHRTRQPSMDDLNVIESQSRNSFTQDLALSSDTTARPTKRRRVEQRKNKALGTLRLVSTFIDVEAQDTDAEFEDDDDNEDQGPSDFIDDAVVSTSCQRVNLRTLSSWSCSAAPEEIVQGIHARAKARGLDCNEPSLHPQWGGLAPMYIVSTPPSILSRLIPYLKKLHGTRRVLRSPDKRSIIYVETTNLIALTNAINEWPELNGWPDLDCRRPERPVLMSLNEQQNIIRRLRDKESAHKTVDLLAYRWVRALDTSSAYNLDLVFVLSEDEYPSSWVISQGSVTGLIVPRVNYRQPITQSHRTPAALFDPESIKHAYPDNKPAWNEEEEVWKWSDSTFTASGLLLVTLTRDKKLVVDGVQPTDEELALFLSSGEPILRWRQVATGLQSLWTSLCIDMKSLHRWRELVIAWFERSGLQSLSLTIKPPPWRQRGRDSLGYLNRLCPKIKRLEVDIQTTGTSLTFLGHYGFFFELSNPNLHHLAVHAIEDSDLALSLDPELAPNLQILQITRIHRGNGDLNLQSATLRKLCIGDGMRISLDSIRGILDSCPSLVHLELVSLQKNNSPDSVCSRREYPKLEHLGLHLLEGICPLLKTVGLPGLTSLACGKQDWTMDVVNIFKLFLEASQCELTSFCGHIPWFGLEFQLDSWTSLLDTLPLVQKLELEIEELGEPSGLSPSLKVVTALLPRLPRLEEVWIRATSQIEPKNLNTQWPVQRSVERLDYFHLHSILSRLFIKEPHYSDLSSWCPTAAEEILLQDLMARGVDFVLRVDADPSRGLNYSVIHFPRNKRIGKCNMNCCTSAAAVGGQTNVNGGPRESIEKGSGAGEMYRRLALE